MYRHSLIVHHLSDVSEHILYAYCIVHGMEMAQYGDSVCNIVEENFNVFFPNPNVLVAVNKGMWAIKLLQQIFWFWGAG